MIIKWHLLYFIDLKYIDKDGSFLGVIKNAFGVMRGQNFGTKQYGTVF